MRSILTMLRLSVNVDHVATLREARKAELPDPVEAAILASLSGADGITVHLRGDRRHIQERDLRLLKEKVKNPLNLEMAATERMIRIAIKTKPNLVTLVPERPQEITTEGGLDVVKNFNQLKKAISRLKSGDLKISMFINPDEESVKTASRLKADFVELNTDKYAEAKGKEEKSSELKNLKKMAELAHRNNLKVHAGHGLNYKNISGIVSIEQIEEASIGHSIVARAVMVGFEKAVREMLELIKK
jgi:pyridoxine 5-phosphate synthase